MTIKQKIIDQIIATEGGYVNHPDDPGGETMYGITENVARQYGYEGDMQKIPRNLAVSIYTHTYWDSLNLNNLEPISPSLAYELADTGVNVGVTRVAKWFQQCLNAFNRDQRLYNDLKVDGKIGPKTLDALKSYMRTRHVKVLIRAVNAMQGMHYLELAQKDKKFEEFTYGWFLNRVEFN